MTLIEVAERTQAEGAQLIRHREGNQYDCKPWGTGNNRHWTMMDAFTGSAIVQIHRALKPENQERYINMSLGKFIDVTWKIANRNG